MLIEQLLRRTMVEPVGPTIDHYRYLSMITEQSGLLHETQKNVCTCKVQNDYQTFFSKQSSLICPGDRPKKLSLC